LTEVQAKRKEVKQLRANISFLEGCLQKYKRFNDSDVNIFDAISATLTFFKKQGSDSMPVMADDFKILPKVEPHLPLNQPQ